MKGVVKKSIDYNKLIKNIDVREELSQRGIEGKISGKNLMVCCPVHQEKRPSMGINVKDKKGLCNCLGCGWKGNFFSLIAFLDNISFEEAVKTFTKENIEIEDIKELESFFLESLEKSEKKVDKIKYYNKKFLDKFKEPFGEYLEYLVEERKLSKKIIKK